MVDELAVKPPKMAKAERPRPAGGQDKTLAILALVFAFIFPLVGLILALVGRKRYPVGTDGHGLNKAALIISIVLLVIPLLFLVIGAVSFFGVLNPTKFTPPV